MPWESKKQQRWGHSPGGKKELTDEQIEEFDSTTDFDSLPEEAAQAGKGPTRTQGPGKSSDTSRTIRRMSREQHKGMPRGGPQTTKKGGKGYTRKQKHKGVSEGEELNPIDETFRGLNFPIAELNWSIAGPWGAMDENHLPATSRPCGEGEDPESGHCNPNLPAEGPTMNPAPEGLQPDFEPTGPVSMEDHMNRAAKKKGAPLDVNEFMAEKKAWQESNPHLSEEREQDQGQRRQQILDQEREEKKRARREYKQAERGDFGLGPGQQVAPPEDPGGSGYMTGPEEYHDEGAPGPYRREAPRRMGSSIAADLNWSTHKSETFNDPGEKGGHPAWGLKSIIDRGVKPHEKPSGDKRIGEAEHQTTKRNIGGKKFKSFSHVLDWS